MTPATPPTAAPTFRELLDYTAAEAARWGEYFEVVRDAAARAGADAKEDEEAALALEIDRVVEALRIVHWDRNPDVQNRMRIEIEDALFRFKKRHAVPWTFADMDAIMEDCLKAARQRSGGGPL